jgi:2,4-dienoyl-CoA reductase-like NADH-dependent reductase (Old Yellow Enzyme family)
VAPSAIPLKAPLNKMFNTPKALSEGEIENLIERFAYAAVLSKQEGFTGLQIHGAHGYLVSQFLSPLHNQRKDKWGGTSENRMRFVLEVYQAMRKAVGPSFPVSIKLNSADFQKGGFSQDESMNVVIALAEKGIDLVEISGGSYEVPEMTGITRAASTFAREAYFLDYCEKIRKHVKTPLMLTGGFRTLEGMNSALASGACDVVGLARSLAINPEFSKELLSGKATQSLVHPLTTGVKALDKIVPLEISWYTHQIHLLGKGLAPKPELNAAFSIVQSLCTMGIQGLKRVRSK